MSSDNSGCVDPEEGSGDSDEIQGASVGTNVRVSAELQNINLSTSHGSSSEISNENKKTVGPCDKTRSKKKMEVLTGKIANAINRIADAYESQSTAKNTLVVPGTSIGEVMTELERMEAITRDPVWHSRCRQLMMFKPAREMFVALKGYEQGLLAWLKYATNKSLPSTLVVPGTSVGEVIAELQHMETIKSDHDWLFRCYDLMSSKHAREMFVALKGCEQRLLDWLKHAAYNPLPFMKNESDY